LIQVKAVSGRAECRARLMVVFGVVLGLILIVVWETVFTPAVHVVDQSNNTLTVSRLLSPLDL